MPFVPHTPEALLARSDSKDPLTTCSGITSTGRPCRRALPNGPPTDAISPAPGGSHVDVKDPSLLFCWQHKDQSQSLQGAADYDPRVEIGNLKGRSSIDTVISRLGILHVGSSVRAKRKRPRRTGGLSSKGKPAPGQTSRKHEPSHVDSLLSILCCMAPPSHGEAFSTARRANDQAQPGPSTQLGQFQRPVASASRKPSHQPDLRSSSSSKAVATGKHHSEIQDFARTPPSTRPPPNATLRSTNASSLIPASVTPQALSLLQAELSKPFAATDEEGYIYIFWLTESNAASPPTPAVASSFLSPPSTPDARPPQRRSSSAFEQFANSAPDHPSSSASGTILLKIGRASNVHRRMNEWTRQCGYDLSLVRFYPYLPSSSSRVSPLPSPLRNVVEPPTPPLTPRKVPHAHRVERLIHLELADKRVKRICGACGREHREWFAVEATKAGVKAVDEVVRRWIAWGERHGNGHNEH